MLASYEKKITEFRIGCSKKLECARHLHAHIEMVVVLSGHPDVLTADAEYRLEPGDLYIAYPNQIHGYRKNDEEFSLLAIFATSVFPELADFFAAQPPSPPIIRNFTKDLALQNLCETLSRVQETDVYAKIRAKGLLLSLLGSVLEQLPRPEKSAPDADIFDSIVGYCARNYRNPIQLSDLAAALHVCKFHISHIINGRMKMNFNDYLNSLRVTEAANLLSNRDLAITEISHLCGFNSTRTFNRAFLKQIGCTPREYRQKRQDFR